MAKYLVTNISSSRRAVPAPVNQVLGANKSATVEVNVTEMSNPAFVADVQSGYITAVRLDTDTPPSLDVAVVAQLAAAAAAAAKLGVETLSSDTIVLNLSTQALKSRAAAAAMNISASNFTPGVVNTRISNGTGGALAITWGSTFRWVGGTAPTTIAAGKVANLRLVCYGTVVGDVLAQWTVES